MKNFLVIIAFSFSISSYSQGLKSIIYDFDGLNIGQNTLPDGDYSNDDLSYQVVQSPVSSEVLGDRVLQVDLNWSMGRGEFGKAVSRFVQLDPATDHLNFYLFDPPSNGNDRLLELVITEDDNADNVYEYEQDDKWVDTIPLQRQGNWQLISIPLSQFKDQNPGGNGQFDAGFQGSGSMLFSIGFNFLHTSFSTSARFYLDMLCFSEGPLPTGNNILELPGHAPDDYCQLGALCNNDFPDSTPDTVSGLFAINKLQFVNWFLDYAKAGTTPNQLPGTEVSNLLSQGYMPVITWEMLYEGYPRLDPVQPRLDQILDGSMDSYIDAFAAKIASYGQPVTIRIFHEFEGDWYPWSLTQNGEDPETYIAAWHHVVDRFRAAGATNARWMWCVNAEPKPYNDYNWIVSAYPGDDYVDVVATDIYNHPDLGVPDWRSFRFTLAESYYYLTKYFPQKPFYICEVASRERYSGEPEGSQSKAEWTCQMSHDLQSWFSKTRALIFFSLVKEHDWRVNSSVAALQAANSCIWQDPYFRSTSTGTEEQQQLAFSTYPNPFSTELYIEALQLPGDVKDFKVMIYDVSGRTVYSCVTGKTLLNLQLPSSLKDGIYMLEVSSGKYSQKIKLVKMTG
ncbi:MAG: glycosyl hydrolase [Bacteroidia bacterium]